MGNTHATTAVYFGEVDVSPDPNHTILIKVALQCFDQDRFELRWAQLLFKDPHNDSLVFTEEHAVYRGKLINPATSRQVEVSWFSLLPTEGENRVWVQGMVPKSKQVLKRPFQSIGGKGRIPSDEQIMLRLHHISQLGSMKLMNVHQSLTHFKLTKLGDAKELDARMSFFSEIEALNPTPNIVESSPTSSADNLQTPLLADPTSPDDGACRICLQGSDEEMLLSLQCNCKGSMSHIHESCLKQWIHMHESSVADDGIAESKRLPAVTCDVCKRIFDTSLVARIVRTLYVEYKDDVTGVTLARKLMMLGKNLQYVGLLEEAAKIMEEGLAYYEEAFDSDEDELADVLSDVSVVYSKQTRYHEALEINERALRIYEKRHGHDHQVANTLNNIAVIYWKQGDHSTALGLYQRSLIISERVLGHSHPHVADTLNNIAAVHTVQAIVDDNSDMYKEALALYYRALHITENAFGDAHPDVAKTCYNIGILYKKLKVYDTAMQFLERDYHISSSLLGVDHEQVLETEQIIMAIQALDQPNLFNIA